MKRIIQAVLLGLAPLAPLQADAPPVTIDSGILHGREDGPVTTFLGIPYAAAPIGLLRWQSPQPTTPWSGVRDATSLGAKCLQYSWAPPLRFEGSEDCLFLNVVTPRPAAGARLPVLVWFHGGGWVNGSSQDVDGRVFAAKGVVVVTVNYRLGAFGFYASPALDAEDPAHVSGNYAQRDQQAALRWVQRNIAAFGGDPAQVTIAGQSAGALSNWIHLVSPAAKGLFARVIGESPVVSFHPAAGLDDARGVGGTKTLQEEEAAGASAHLASILGCDASADPLACMRGKPAPDIVAAMKPGVPGWGVGWGPVVDGVLLPASPPALLAKRRPPIAVLTGGNWGENGIFTLRKLAFGEPLMTAADYAGLVSKLPRGADILAHYPATAFASAEDAYVTMRGDARVCINIDAARTLAPAGPLLMY
jgi:para-nitrobenzyl esterase